MSKKFRILLGTTENSVIFANVRFDGYFSVSFDEVCPVVVTDDYLKMMVESTVDSIDNDTKLSLLERYDCRPSELVDEYLHDQLNYCGVEGIIDISLYPESFSNIAEDDIYFESGGCGQHDTRDTLIPINPEFSNWLHIIWDTWHLKSITKEKENEFISKIEEYEDEVGDIDEWIRVWLEMTWYPSNK